MPDLVDPNHYEYTYPEERDPNSEHYRVDVVFEGALEFAENFTLGDAEEEYQRQIDTLKENHADRRWVVNIYDERPYPPESIAEFVNTVLDN